VVREQEHVRAQVRPRGEEPRLGGAAHVAREEHAPVARLHADHEGAVVASSRPGVRRRPERHDAQVTEHGRHVPRAALEDRRARTARRLEEGREVGVRAGAPGQPDGSHRDPPEQPGKAAAMVEVRVARDHEVEAFDAERRERREHDGAAEIEAAGERGARVHEQRARAPLHQHGVARAHVQDDETRRLRRKRCGRSDAEDRDRDERRRDPPRDAGRGETGQRHEARAREDERPGCGRQGRSREDARQRGHRREGPVRRRQRHGERRLERSGGTARHERRSEGERQHDPARPRHRDHVHQQREGRHHAEVEGGERGGREDRARRGRDQAGEPVAQPRSLGRGSGTRARGEHERRARREGELRARVEERLRLVRQDPERREGEGMAAARRPRPGHRRRAREHDHEGPAHGHLEAGEQRVDHRERCGDAERGRAHVEARRERGGAHQDPPREGEDEGGEHREVQPGDREQVRDAEGREVVAGLHAEARALAQGEGGEERPALPPRLEPLGGAGAQRVQRRQGTAPLAVHDARGEAGMLEARDRSHPRAREPALLAPAAGVVPVPGSTQPQASAHAVPRKGVLQRGDTRGCRDPEHVHARGDPRGRGIDAPHGAELHAERPAAPHHRADRGLDGRHALGLRPRRGRGLELPGEPGAPCTERGEEQHERARPASASSRHGAGEERDPGGGGRQRRDRRPVRDADAERIREREVRKTGQGRAAGDRGGSILPERRRGS
jgi:hypothetical protein